MLRNVLTVGGWTAEGGAPPQQHGNMPEEAGAATAVMEDPKAAGIYFQMEGQACRIHHGSVIIAAITSCTPAIWSSPPWPGLSIRQGETALTRTCFGPSSAA